MAIAHTSCNWVCWCGFQPEMMYHLIQMNGFSFIPVVQYDATEQGSKNPAENQVVRAITL